MIVYADTSALVKLLVDEFESPVVRAWFRSSHDSLVGAELVRTELHCALRRRAGARYDAEGVESVVELAEMFEMDAADFRAAAAAAHRLRAADALHLAVAQRLEVDAMLVYDAELAAAAEAAGLRVLTPR